MHTRWSPVQHDHTDSFAKVAAALDIAVSAGEQEYTLPHAHYPCEYSDYSGTQDMVFTQPVRPIDGKFTLTDAPGLGLDLIESALHERLIPWSSSAARQERRAVG